MTLPEAAPRFDCVKMKREIQAQIYQETKDMTTDEWLDYVRKGSEEFRTKVARYRAERAALVGTDN